MTDGAECNDRVASGDVTVMRTAKSKIGSAIAVAGLVASAGLAVSQGIATADPAAGHQVRYTLTTAAGTRTKRDRFFRRPMTPRRMPLLLPKNSRKMAAGTDLPFSLRTTGDTRLSVCE